MAVNGHILNFGAGPAKLPRQVLERAQKELMNYADLGISILEMSARTDEFMQVVTNAENTLRDMLNIPANYKILFLQGGGRGQFAAIPMNLICRCPSRQADYVVTGHWSAMAAKEAEKYGKVNLVLPKVQRYTTVPDVSEWQLSSDASYVFYCANETVDGVELYNPPETNGVPLVCDMSSNFLSRSFDVSKFGLVFAGAQKNLGCAGVTLIIVREDLLGSGIKELPSVWDYQKQIAMQSCLNTPPTFNIYILGLTLEWVKNERLEEVERRTNEKSRLLYEAINTSNGFYVSNIDERYRSRTTLPFRIGTPVNESLEKKFLQEAAKRNMIQIKGHRSVGGLRICFFNAVSVEEVAYFVDFMKLFQETNSTPS